MYRPAVVCTTIKLIIQIDNLYIRSLVIQSCNHALQIKNVLYFRISKERQYHGSGIQLKGQLSCFNV